MRGRIFYYLNQARIFFWLFVFVFFLQFLLWLKTSEIKPQYDIVPNLPNKNLVKIMALGDNEFLFRVMALRVQNSGDIFAGFVPLTKYDYKKLFEWFNLLDSLNEKSVLMPALASYYYSQTPNISDIHYVLDYLIKRSDRDLNANWWWLFQAINISDTVFKDDKLTLELALKLSTNSAKDAPLWTKEIPAFIYAKQENNCMAFKIIQEIVLENSNSSKKLTIDERNFIKYFIEKRLTKFKKQQFDPRKCLNIKSPLILKK